MIYQDMKDAMIAAAKMPRKPIVGHDDPKAVEIAKQWSQEDDQSRAWSLPIKIRYPDGATEYTVWNIVEPYPDGAEVVELRKLGLAILHGKEPV